ncbi:MAG: amidohydrolase family protein [Deltaproteobacteria bacterium]|nr:amidohydrolase family protein [Deltaproteobacteria bacterium]
MKNNEYRVRLPLLKDNHSHTLTYSAMHGAPTLAGIDAKESAVEFMTKLEHKINVLLDWDETKFHFNEKELSSFPPVLICNVSLHKYIINLSARAMLKSIDENIAKNIEDQAWVEKNLLEVLKFIASLMEFNDLKMGLHFGELENAGVWYAEDMCVFDIGAVKYYKDSKYRNRTSLWASFPDYLRLPDNLRKEIKGIKVFADGALAAHSAALAKNYIAGGGGMLIYTNDELLKILHAIAGMNKPIAIHAIGDAALDQAASVLRKIGVDKGNIQVRLEHCQFITKKIASELKSHGVVLSMQPNFSRDSIRYADRLPSAYRNQNNPFRMLIDDIKYKPGEDLLFGSDGMPHGMEQALKWSLFPPYKSQQLKIEEFINGYCMPDMKNGYAEVEIDEEKESVRMIGLSLET